MGNPGLVFNSIVNDSRLLKAHVPTSKICLLLLLNLLQIYYRFASATIYDRAECRSRIIQFSATKFMIHISKGTGSGSFSQRAHKPELLGTIHKGRPQNFRDFWPPPPLVRIFLLFLWPPYPRGRPFSAWPPPPGWIRTHLHSPNAITGCQSVEYVAGCSQNTKAS